MTSLDTRMAELRLERRKEFIQWAYGRRYPILGILLDAQDTWSTLTKVQRRDLTRAVDAFHDGAPIDWNTFSKWDCPRLLSSTSSRSVSSMRRKGVVQEESLRLTRHGVVVVLVCAEGPDHSKHVHWAMAATPGEPSSGRRYPDPDPCVMRPDRPHVCLRPDHDARHGKTTPRGPA